jgi:putative SOS response-associated peptidase YedK
MLMAGLFDSVVLEGQVVVLLSRNTEIGYVGESRPLWTFSIVTTSANKDFSWLHDRQPVFLPTRQALDKWLDASLQKWTPELTKMVEPYHGSVPLLWSVTSRFPP